MEITEFGQKIEVWKDFEPTPVREYLKPQGRFRHLTDEEIDGIEKDVERKWHQLLAKEKMMASIPGME
jgi:pyruvate/2-oxoacid:ferredoxin oxidoreductase beta subunit